MKALLYLIETLENKIDNGTATMEQEAQFKDLVDLAERLIYNS